MALLAMVPKFATRLRCLHCYIVIIIELVSSSARVTSVKSTQGVGLTDGHTDPKIGPQVYLGLIKIECCESQ